MTSDVQSNAHATEKRGEDGLKSAASAIERFLSHTDAQTHSSKIIRLIELQAALISALSQTTNAAGVATFLKAVADTDVREIENSANELLRGLLGRWSAEVGRDAASAGPGTNA